MHVVDFYDRHPISASHVLAAVARQRGGAEAGLTADDLFPFDQDHYGALEAVEVLARRAGVGPGSRVLDVGAGLGGPARFIATRRRARVVGIELNHLRAAGARRLTALVGLAAMVGVVRADAVSLPLRSASFDACLSQEVFLHVEDKAAVLAECFRVLVAGGRLAFTDWVAHPRLSDAERQRLRDWTAATALPTIDAYRVLIGRAGFHAVEAEDVTAEWRPILRTRLERHRALGADIANRLGARWYDEYRQVYGFFVRLIEEGRLGGARFTATR